MSKPSDSGKRPETRVITAGREPFAHHGAVNPPVYHASTILHRTIDALDNHGQPYTYGRRLTPPIEALQVAITELEGAAGTVLCPSGLQACTLSILTVAGAGDHILVKIETLFRPSTRAIFLESPGSLTFEVQDVPAIAEAAHAAGIAVILDNTWATPLLFDAIGHGADLSVMAATKYIVGHSDAMLGTVAANERWLKPLKDTHGNLGLCVGPDDIYLGQRGLRTLAVRLKQHEANAMQLATWLAARPEVTRVLYPALPDDPGHAIWKRDFRGASGLFGVELKPCSKAALADMLENLELFGMGWSWGGYESLIVPSHPHRTARRASLQGPLIRIHAGLESADDLIADLDAGLARLNKHA